MKNSFSDLTAKEKAIFRTLNTPIKIQDFLNTLPINFEPEGDTCLSPRRVLTEQRAHCIEGALLAAAILWYHGEQPLLLDLKTTHNDFDHVVALFQRQAQGKTYWGAISKTNHNVLRFRDPVYRNVRELAMSYFHEYFWDDGSKTLRSYSRPFSLASYPGWITASGNLWDIPSDLDSSRHYSTVPVGMVRALRKADMIEQDATERTDWQDPKTSQRKT